MNQRRRQEIAAAVQWALVGAIVMAVLFLIVLWAAGTSL